MTIVATTLLEFFGVSALSCEVYDLIDSEMTLGRPGGWVRLLVL